MEIATRLKMNQKEQTEIVLENFSKMLMRRGKIDNYLGLFNKLKSIENKNIFTVKEKNLDLLLIIEFQKLNGIKKGSDIEDNLLKFKGDKFLIALDVSNKTFSQSKSFNTELFRISELLSDIPSNPLIPEHQIVSEDQKTEIYKVFKEKNFAKILSNDMMVRYLGAKKGDLIKIIRPELNTGESIYYRKVI